jgi:hypothetical protein
VQHPNLKGGKAKDQGQQKKNGVASNTTPLFLEFNTTREGYHLLSAKLTHAGQEPTRAYIKVEYEAPANSDKF